MDHHGLCPSCGRGDPPFPDAIALAETATGMVLDCLEAGRDDLALVLQPVAAALWGSLQANLPVRAYRGVLVRALHDLRLRCGAEPLRGFLEAALRHAAAERAP